MGVITGKFRGPFALPTPSSLLISPTAPPRSRCPQAISALESLRACEGVLETVVRRGVVSADASAAVAAVIVTFPALLRSLLAASNKTKTGQPFGTHLSTDAHA